MDLFIETPQRSRRRAELVSAQHAELWALDLDEAPGFDGSSLGAACDRRDGPAPADSGTGHRAGSHPAPLAADAYREALSFDRARSRRRGAAGAVRVLALLVAVPVAMALLFLASYALTCIVNGATPEELGELMAELVSRVAGFASQLLDPSRAG